jgi:galactitol-specific phosphotransferase system IIC component
MKKLNLNNIDVANGWELTKWNKIENGNFILSVAKNQMFETFEIILEDTKNLEVHDIVDNEQITPNTLRTINQIIKEFGFELTI